MQVTEVKVRTIRDSGKEKLRAFASITFDNSFVVREVKVIEGDKGLFVAMPGKKITEKCYKCNHRNVIQSKFCNMCGNKLAVHNNENEFIREKIYMDLAHPINSECRNMIHNAVIEEYKKIKDQIDSTSTYNNSQDTKCEEKEPEIKRYLKSEIPEPQTAAKDDDSFNQGIFT